MLILLHDHRQGPGQEEPKSSALSRPGAHTCDRGYWQLYLTWQGLNVSLEWVGTNAGKGLGPDQQLAVLVTVIGGNASDFELTVYGTTVFERGGRAMADVQSPSLSFETPGLRSVTITPLTAPSGHVRVNSTSVMVAVGLGEGVAAAGSSAYTTLDQVQRAVGSARKAAIVALPGASPDMLVAVTAMQSCLMWNAIYAPLEAAAFVQVSRSFAFWPYELFEWDTYFGALMLSSSQEGLPLALSSIIQVTKSKTLGPQLDGHGFVPGYNKGGRWLSEDRTERPMGAQVLLQVWKRWGNAQGLPAMEWVLELLYTDLMDWNNWLWTERRSGPLGLAVMGSDPCFTPGTNHTKL